MIVDTNVLLRVLEGDTGAQGEAVRRRVARARASGDTLTVIAPTVLEVGYVLESARAGYDWDRPTIVRAVEAILDEPGFAVEHEAALRRAVETYEAQSIDLHDCFLSAIAEQRRTPVLSFDKDLHRLGTAEPP